MEKMMAPLRSAYDEQCRKWPDFARQFPDPDGEAFWLWLNRYGIFADPSLQSVTAPFPPVELMCCGSNDDSNLRFAHSGAEYYGLMEEALNGLGRSWAGMGSVLDFGCGIGRVSRLFARHAHHQRFHGFDLTTGAIDWLSGNLGFGDFRLGFEHPPLPLENRSLDAIFSISVFTHLSASSQAAWLSEFARVMKPDAILFQTVHGRHAMELCLHHTPWKDALNVAPEDFERLRTGLEADGFAWVPHSMQTTGTQDYGVSFQNEEYILRHWCSDFDLVGIWPGRIDGWQDLVALRRRRLPELPDWREERPPVEAVRLTSSAAPAIGCPMTLRAEATGGDDVHYRFYLSEMGGSYRIFRDWSPDPSVDYVPWQGGDYIFIVHAISGAGPAAVPSAEDGISVTCPAENR